MCTLNYNSPCRTGLILKYLVYKIKQKNAELRADKCAPDVQSATMHSEIAGPCRVHSVSVKQNLCHQGMHRFVGDDKPHNHQENGAYI